MNTAGLGPVVSHRRIDRDKVRVLAELMLAYPGATTEEYAQRIGCSRRTLERWRKTEAFETELHDLARHHYASVLLPKALRAAEKMLDHPGTRSDTLVIEVLRSSGLLGIQRVGVDMHHTVEHIDIAAKRAEFLAKLQAMSERAGDQEPPAFEDVQAARARLTALPGQIVDGTVIDASEDGQN